MLWLCCALVPISVMVKVHVKPLPHSTSMSQFHFSLGSWSSSCFTKLKGDQELFSWRYREEGKDLRTKFAPGGSVVSETTLPCRPSPTSPRLGRGQGQRERNPAMSPPAPSCLWPSWGWKAGLVVPISGSFPAVQSQFPPQGERPLYRHSSLCTAGPGWFPQMFGPHSVKLYITYTS